MKRALFAAAAGALGALGTAGLMAAAPAQAACNDDTPPLTPARVACVTNANISEFVRTTSPQYNLDVLVNGTKDDPQLGLVNQPGEFVRSVGDFFDGPREPEPAPESANE